MTFVGIAIVVGIIGLCALFWPRGRRRRENVSEKVVERLNRSELGE